MIEIKRIEKNDLNDLSLLFEELSGKKTDFEIMIKNFEWINKNEDYIVLGAHYNGKLVGSLMGIICHDLVGECKPFMVIENVIVSINLRGKGIGKKLMNEIERIGKEKNCYYTMFVSGSQRKDAHKFYESLGYKLDEVQGFKKYLG
jgi:GNAT superfamily N-acetyltransferase